MDNKIFKRIFIIFIILVVVLIGLVIAMKVYQDRRLQGKVEYSQEDLNIIDNQVNNYLKNKIVPAGMSTMYGKYKGDNELSDLYKSMYNFVHYIPTIYENDVYDMNDKDLEKFFNDEKEDIIDNIGAETVEEFKAVVDHLNECNYNGEEYVSCEVMPKEIVSQGGFFIVNIGFTFKDIQEPIVFTIHFANVGGAHPIAHYLPEE